LKMRVLFDHGKRERERETKKTSATRDARHRENEELERGIEHISRIHDGTHPSPRRARR